MGNFQLTGSDRRQVFIATGTGIAPLLPMMAQVDNALLIFGARTAATDLTRRLDSEIPAMVVRCYSREGERQRVTDVLSSLDVDWEGSDFYLCGSADMVADCQRLLHELGAKHVMTEKY